MASPRDLLGRRRTRRSWVWVFLPTPYTFHHMDMGYGPYGASFFMLIFWATLACEGPNHSTMGRVRSVVGSRRLINPLDPFAISVLPGMAGVERPDRSGPLGKARSRGTSVFTIGLARGPSAIMASLEIHRAEVNFGLELCSETIRTL